jgi:regulator of sigma E protease
MEVIQQIFYFIIVLGLLVFIHEFGHFIAARMSGMRVDTFAIGMGKRLFGYNKINGFTAGNLPEEFDQQGNTDYRVSMLPIGGYVKIAGMIDESMDNDFADTEPQPWEFRSKNTFQKAFTISAGVIMNALLTIGIFTAFAFFNGAIEYRTTEIGYVAEKSVAQEVGLHAGDKILSVNGQKIEDWGAFNLALALTDIGNSKNIELIRDGKRTSIVVDNVKINKALSNKEPLGLIPNDTRSKITGVDDTKPAGKAGILAGDIIEKINGELITSNIHLQKKVKENAEKKILLEWTRDGKMMSDSLTPLKNGTIGIGITQTFIGEKIHVDYTFTESISVGFSKTYDAMMLFFGSIGQIIEGNISFKQAVGGPLMIAKQAAETAEMGLEYFVNFIALLSITLAVINILPIPALDGGHLVFIIIEGILRREVSNKVKIVFQQVGLFLLLGLMAFIIFVDVSRYF